MPIPTPSVTRVVSSATVLIATSSAFGSRRMMAIPTAGTNTASVSAHSWNQFIAVLPTRRSRASTEDHEQQGEQPDRREEDEGVPLHASGLDIGHQPTGVPGLVGDAVHRAVDDVL